MNIKILLVNTMISCCCKSASSSSTLFFSKNKVTSPSILGLYHNDSSRRKNIDEITNKIIRKVNPTTPTATAASSFCTTANTAFVACTRNKRLMKQNLYYNPTTSIISATNNAHASSRSTIMNFSTSNNRNDNDDANDGFRTPPPALEDDLSQYDRPFDDYFDTLSLHEDKPSPPSISSLEESKSMAVKKESITASQTENSLNHVGGIEKDNDDTTNDYEDMKSTFQSILESDSTPTSQPEKKDSSTSPNNINHDDSNNEDTITRYTLKQLDAETLDFLSKSSDGNGYTSKLDILQQKLDDLTNQIYKLNNGIEFNINSPKQVANAIHGPITEQQSSISSSSEDRSTNKDVLEALASSGFDTRNRMADSILQYRIIKSNIKRLSKRLEASQNGNHVTYSSLRQQHSTTTATTTTTTMKEEKDDPLLLADASSYIFRAYYSMPPLHRSSDGTPVGAVLGCCNMLNKLILNQMLDGERPRFVLVFDAPPSDDDEDTPKTFRHELYSNYKANRKACPIDLVPQFDLVKEAALAYGIPTLECPKYEADDVIATIVENVLRNEGGDGDKDGGSASHSSSLSGVNVLSGDKDLMQLVTEPDVRPSVHMIEPMNMIRISHDEVLSKWGVPPSKLGDVLALAGDASDNIPGVPGIGPKIAASLINEFGSLEELLDRADEIKQKGRREKVLDNIDKAQLSRKLVELESSIPLNAIEMTSPSTYLSNIRSMGDLRMNSIDTKRLLDFYDRMGFWDMKQRVKERMIQKGLLDERNYDADFEESITSSAHNKDFDAAFSSPSSAAGANLLDNKTDPQPSLSSMGLSTESSSSKEGESSFKRLIINKVKKKSPPKSEEFDDIPF